MALDTLDERMRQFAAWAKLLDGATASGLVKSDVPTEELVEVADALGVDLKGATARTAISILLVREVTRLRG